MAHATRLPSDYFRNAAYPLLAIDPARDEGLIMRFTRDDYRRASFLDARALGDRALEGWTVPLAELATAFANADPPAVQWLFHIGHCGSTLCSRLLDLLPGVLGLREPLPLLALAQQGGDDVDRWLPATLHMLARRFDESDVVVVKPTSLVTTLSDRLLDMTRGRACLVWIDLQAWLATILRDAGLRSATLASTRRRSMDFSGAPATRGDGETLARIWLSEQLRWRALAMQPAHAGRLIDLDFAAVLDDPVGAIAGLAAHYGIAVPSDWADRVEASGLLGRYAKDDRQVFDAATRQQELAASVAAHRDEIDAGLRWTGQWLASQPSHAWLHARLGA